MARRCDLTGKGVLSGNNVSHAVNKTRRRFLPNLCNVKLASDTLGRSVRVRASAAALRSVEHKGGLDAFLSDARPEQLSLELRRMKRDLAKARAAGETVSVS